MGVEATTDRRILFSLDPGTYPEREFIDRGRRVTGQEFTIGGNRVVLKKTDDRAQRSRAIEYLVEKPASKLTAVSMLHPATDAPILRRVSAAWGRGDLVTGLTTDTALDRLFRLHQGERIVFFGHIERLSDSGAAGDVPTWGFVAHDRHGNATAVPLVNLWALAEQHGVEAIIVGCNAFGAGASAGPLRDLDGSALPRILATMKAAESRAEVLAAMGTREHPVFIDPELFVSHLSLGQIRVRRLGENRSRAIIYVAQQEAPARAPPQFNSDADVDLQGPTTDDSTVSAATSDWGDLEVRWWRTGSWEDFFRFSFFALLGVGFIEYGLLVPLSRIAKYLGYATGRNIWVPHFDAAASEPQKVDLNKPPPEESVGCLMMFFAAFALSQVGEAGGAAFGLAFILMSTLIALFFVGRAARAASKEYER